jgi:AraC-like DNA-binding protein
MLYLEHKPAPPLSRFIRVLWCARAPQLGHRRERVLPTGCAQVILSLARDFLLDCPEGQPEQRTAPALIVGQRSVYEMVDTSDMADLIGMVFAPGALPVFAADAADLFNNRNVPLEEVWGDDTRTLRDRLREIPSPQERLCCLERFLLTTFAPRMDQPRHSLHPAVEFALNRFERASVIGTVAEVARSTGWSERRLSQLFREQVGFTPKVWCRIQRFQRVVRQLHAGVNAPWPELALECGFYDQAHFANEFRAFSGIDATTYTTTHGTPGANHVRAD